ncbi:MAG: S9 family peptidase, partial [Desulfobacteraceae bacterium]|nr:S9 family peptidase [Desulfobacteraceae bacterium]
LKMWNWINISTFLTSFLCVFSCLVAQNHIPAPSFEQIISLRNVNNPKISPDGKSILFEVRTTNWKKNSYDTEIWLARDGEEPFQLTRTVDGASNAPQWSPDGQWIAFLADRGDKSQIHLIRSNGGEAQKITREKEGIKNFRWSPDGKRIAFTETDIDSSDEKEREKRYGKFNIEDKEYHNTHLWIVEVKPDMWPSPVEVPCYESGVVSDSLENKDESNKSENDCISLPKSVQLTEGDMYTVQNFEWSPDGAKIAFEHRSDPLINSYVTADISILTVETKEIQPLVSNPGYDGKPKWSPDSNWIIYYTSAGDTISDYYKNGQLHKIPAKGGKPTQLAGDLDEWASNIVWTPKGIFLLAWQHTKRYIFKVDPETGETKLFAKMPENIWSIDFSKDGNIIALSGRTATSLNEIYKTMLSSYKPIALTKMSQQIETWELGTSEIISWESKDGTLIEGVLHKPKSFNPKRKYPLLVVIHGGPASISTPSPIAGYVYPITQWLAKGAIVLRPNYRGSAGYGEAFRSLNVRNLGVGDAWDVITGVSHVIKQGFVDSTRLGAMGWSQGGYISAFLTTTSNRFKAISVGAGISNWMTYYVNTDIHPFTRQYLKATPWDDPEIYARTSPMTTIVQAQTPTLIQHGEFDKRVPIPNSYELYQGLQDVGVETKLIVYKGFGHGINKPKERLAATWHNWQWFAKHIWDEEVKLPSKKEQSEKPDLSSN